MNKKILFIQPSIYDDRGKVVKKNKKSKVCFANFPPSDLDLYSITNKKR